MNEVHLRVSAIQFFPFYRLYFMGSETDSKVWSVHTHTQLARGKAWDATLAPGARLQSGPGQGDVLSQSPFKDGSAAQCGMQGQQKVPHFFNTIPQAH